MLGGPKLNASTLPLPDTRWSFASCYLAKRANAHAREGGPLAFALHRPGTVSAIRDIPHTARGLAAMFETNFRVTLRSCPRAL